MDRAPSTDYFYKTAGFFYFFYFIFFERVKTVAVGYEI